VDEPIDATQCGGKENCRDEQKCLTHDLWNDLNNHIFEYLRRVTLAELVEKNRHRMQELAIVELHDNRPNRRRPEPLPV
jgi:Rrf2 family iron-sulfur cluster assembly transcriptional regulator